MVSVIEQAELTGKVVVSALVAIGYAGYSFYEYGWNNTNAAILMVGGLLALIAATPATECTHPSSSSRWLPVVPIAICRMLAAYQFYIIGLLALALAIAEQSGWWALIWSVIWIFVGWRALSGLAIARNERRRCASQLAP